MKNDWVLVIIFVANSFGINTSSLVTLISVISLAISMSFQNILTNAISGVIILSTKPFKLGDYIEGAGTAGVVKDIGIIRTVLTTPDNKEVMIPNADITSSTIVNYAIEPKRRVDMKFSASYDSDIDFVKESILEILQSDSRVYEDDSFKPFVRVSAYNSNDIEYTVRAWVDNANYWDVYFDTTEEVSRVFKKKGIEFSYPHTVVHMAKD